MSTYEETVAACALNKLFGDHPKPILQQVEKAGSALALFESELDRSQLDWAVKELENVRKGGFRFLSFFDEDYPPPLRELPDPPLGIYLSASTSPAEIFTLRPMVGFVGTRDLSPYGRAWCQKLVKGLADAHVPPTIVSGLALGIDGISHQTALDCGLPTIGVMATGIEEIYPRQHETLARNIVHSPGSALLTDYPMHTTSMAWNFIRRNRIIAGLARAVVVVESKTKGGSLMTARYANDYEREVYAVPGRLDDTRSAGCNSLIEAQMAHIITSPEQLVDALGLGGARRHRGQGGSWATYQPGDPPEEILRARLTKHYGPSSPMVPVGLAIQAERGISAQELSARLQRPYPEILAALGSLEADGIITTDLLGRCSLTSSWS